LAELIPPLDVAMGQIDAEQLPANILDRLRNPLDDVELERDRAERQTLSVQHVHGAHPDLQIRHCVSFLLLFSCSAGESNPSYDHPSHRLTLFLVPSDQ